MHVAPLQSQRRNEVTVKLLVPSFHGMPGWRTFPFALQCLAQWENNESQLWYPGWLILVTSTVPELLVLVLASDLSRGQLGCSCENCWYNQRQGWFSFRTWVCVLHAQGHHNLIFHGFREGAELREVRVQGHQVGCGLLPGRRGGHCIPSGISQLQDGWDQRLYFSFSFVKMCLKEFYQGGCKAAQQ